MSSSEHRRTKYLSSLRPTCSFIVAVFLSYSTTVLSAEYSTGRLSDFGQIINSQKDECLIVAKNCNVGDETIMQRVDRLNKEINKGTDVYTPEELQFLQQQLDWINSDSAEYTGGAY
jgi:hypothetical protein